MSCFCLFQSVAYSFVPILESGEVVKKDFYQLGLAPTVYTSPGGGGQMSVFLDGHLGEGLGFRTFLGTGTYDFLGGGTVKFVPFPDVDNQPAMGLRGGFLMSRKNSVNALALEITPMASKTLSTEKGPIVPYVAVPVRWVSADTKYFSTTAAFGCEWYPTEIQDYFFRGEIGLELKDSASYIAISGSLPFDKLKGF